MHCPFSLWEIVVTNAPPPPVWDATPVQAGSVRYAGFWLRVVAALIDFIALGIVSKIAMFFVPTPTVVFPANPDFDTLMHYAEASNSTVEIALVTLLTWAYFAFQESSSAQATLGKRALGIRVSALDGSRMSLGKATLRAWPIYLPNLFWSLGIGMAGLVTLVAFVACLTVAFSSRKQGLHDMMAGTLMIKT
jgi:uncharacterized RDD family membrane protein YckC